MHKSDIMSMANIPLSGDLLVRLEHLADSTQRTKEGLICEAVREFVERWEKSGITVADDKARRKDLLVTMKRIRAMTPRRLTSDSVDLIREDRDNR